MLPAKYLELYSTCSILNLKFHDGIVLTLFCLQHSEINCIHFFCKKKLSFYDFVIGKIGDRLTFGLNKFEYQKFHFIFKYRFTVNDSFVFNTLAY
jgi:hypothetical protein